MVKEEYRNIGEPEDRVVEECGEVIKAVMKCKRFGPDNFHPEDPHASNIMKLMGEVGDVNSALADYIQKLNIMRTQQEKTLDLTSQQEMHNYFLETCDVSGDCVSKDQFKKLYSLVGKTIKEMRYEHEKGKG